MTEIIEQPDGYRDVHVWESHGQVWACCVYDHGPFCRLCQPVDETMAALLDCVREGKLLAKADAVGGFLSQGHGSRGRGCRGHHPQHARGCGAVGPTPSARIRG